jgi:D-alanyl-D-alanine dipeptidase
MRHVLTGAALAVALAWSGPVTVSAAPDGAVPPVSAQARAAGLIDVRTAVPDAIIDLRYTTAHDVQVQMFEAVPDPAWVAQPGDYARSHESARSVDVTLAARGRLVEMGTDFDDFSPRATAYATEGVSTAAQANRAVLRTAMAAGGLAVYAGEWWHFDGPGAGDPRPILDVPVN